MAKIHIFSIDNRPCKCILCKTKTFPAILAEYDDNTPDKSWEGYVCSECISLMLDESGLETLAQMMDQHNSEWRACSEQNILEYFTEGTAKNSRLMQIIEWEKQDSNIFMDLSLARALRWKRAAESGFIGNVSTDLELYLNFYGNDPELVEGIRKLALKKDDPVAIYGYIYARTRSLTPEESEELWELLQDESGTTSKTYQESSESVQEVLHNA